MAHVRWAGPAASQTRAGGGVHRRGRLREDLAKPRKARTLSESRRMKFAERSCSMTGPDMLSLRYVS